MPQSKGFNRSISESSPPQPIHPTQESVERCAAQSVERLHAAEEDLYDALKKAKKEVRESVEAESAAVKKKVELETNEVRERLSATAAASKAAAEAEAEDRKREAAQIRQQMTKEKEEARYDIVHM